MPGYDLVNQQCTMEEGPTVVAPEELDLMLQRQDTDGNAALLDEFVPALGTDPYSMPQSIPDECAPQWAEPLADNEEASDVVENAGPDGWGALADTVDHVGTARNRLGIIRDLATLPLNAPGLETPLRGADPTGGRLDGASRGLSLAGGAMRVVSGMHDVIEARENGAPTSELIHASRDVISGSGWMASGMGDSQTAGGLALVSNTMRVGEGICEFAEGAETEEEQVNAGEDIFHGAVNVGLMNRPELRRAYALGNDIEDRSDDYMTREGSLVGDSALLGRNNDGTSRNWSDWAADVAVDADDAVVEATGSEGLGTAAGLVTCAGTSIVGAGGALVTGIAGYATDAYDALTGW